MDNLAAVGATKYQPALKIKVTKEENIVIFASFVWVLIKSFIDYIPTLILSIWRLIFGETSKDIRGQLALVTGSANGFGKDIAIQLAMKGCNVIIADLDYDEAKSVALQIAEKYKVKTKAFRVDVSDIKSIQKLRDDIENNVGYVDILVNNAGVLPLMSLREGTPSDIQRIIDVNLTSHFWTCRTFLNGMIQRKRGHIVAIASTASFFPITRSCAYCATKFGVRGLMKALYLELCCDRCDNFINLTTVCPWFINTRKELTDLVEKMLPTTFRLDSEECAEKVVAGIVKNKELVILPGIFNLMLRVVECTPRGLMKCFIFNYVKNPEKRFMDNGL